VDMILAIGIVIIAISAILAIYKVVKILTKK